MSVVLSLIAFVCFFGAGLAGMRLRDVLPEHHLDDDSHHLLDIALGIIGTVGGLVLGLLVGTAFGSFNAERTALVQISANVVVLDRILAHYGPPARPARTILRIAVSRTIDQLWPPPGHIVRVAPAEGANAELFDAIENLEPRTSAQTSLKGAASSIALTIAQARWQMYEQLQAGLSPVIITLLIFWFSITFLGLGLYARPNATVITALFLAALAVAGAIFILEEMSTPLQGIMRLSSDPLRAALAHLGQ
jgi:hypothetical protein